MNRKINLFLQGKLSNIIHIEKLGILFRPLTCEEKTNILLFFDTYFFNKKAKTTIRNILEFKNNKGINFYTNKRKYNIFYSYNDEQRIAALIAEQYSENNVLFNKKTIKKRLDRIIIAEFSEEITQYVDENLNYIFLSNIIKILLYKKNIYNISELKNKSICDPYFDIFSEDISKKCSSILNYINTDHNNIFEELNITEFDLIQFRNFIEYLSVERIRDFAVAIDSIFSKSISADNILLNYVGCIERILVKYEKHEKYDIGKQIFLKYGLCINEKDEKNIEEHIKNLKYCYEIRSCIIHGNDNDLLLAPQKILKIPKKEIESFINSKKYSNNRFTNIYIAIMYLEKNLDILFQIWIDNPSRIEFLKNN